MSELQKREAAWAQQCSEQIEYINNKFADGLLKIHAQYNLEMEEQERVKSAAEQKKAAFLAKCLEDFERAEAEQMNVAVVSSTVQNPAAVSVDDIIVTADVPVIAVDNADPSTSRVVDAGTSSKKGKR